MGRFFARDYKKEDLVKKVMIEKNDGTKEIKSEWEERRFPAHQGNLRVSALPPEPVMSPGRQLPPERANPMWSAQPLDPSRWGGQRGQIENPMVGGMMWKDPSWLGVPQARAAPAPRRVQPRVSDPMNTRPVQEQLVVLYTILPTL